MALDRRLTFDEHLMVVVRDEQGKVRKSLPKVGAKDDAKKGAAATTLFKSVKKDVESVSAMQVARLEEAMCSGRSWTQEDFQQFFVEHPLMIHLVRRLVWAIVGKDGSLTLFRIAEDRTPTDVNDEELALPAGKVALAHRLQMKDADVSAWGEVFADYELLQPFDQLGRATYRLTDEEKASRSIDRMKGQVIATGKVMSMTKYGWLRGAPQDAGVIHWMERSAPNGGTFMLELDPGIIVGMPEEWPEQTLGAVTLQATGGWYARTATRSPTRPTP